MNAATDLAWLLAPAAALLAACLVLVPLGAQVLARGVVFIDLAVAQVAACGVLGASMFLQADDAVLTGVAAASASLLGGALVWWLARRWPEQREALIGLVYVAAASASVIAVAFDPHGRERLAALLAADVLWAQWPSVLMLAALATLVAGISAVRGELLRRDTVFYPLFALALSVSVQALGLYLVFAFLIGPALWTCKRLSLPGSIGVAAAGCAVGLSISWALDWPSGACVALVLSALGLLSALLRPRTPAA